MGVEILSVLLHRNASEIASEGQPAFDLGMLQNLARAYDSNGFDRVLILQNSFAPDPLSIASYAAAVTTKLRFMVAHRPGFIAPTMAARMFATLDHLTNGRAGVHIITGANDAELRCDGDYLTKDERYLRSAEYVGIMRQIWGASAPVSHQGEYYRFENALSNLRPVKSGGIPIYWAGSSPLALEKGGEVADVFALGGLKPADDTIAAIDAINGAAAKAGRTVKVQTSARIILGDTEEAALANARHIAEQLEAVGEEQQRKLRENANATMGGMRLGKDISTAKGGAGNAQLDKLAEGPDWVGKHLWAGTTKASRNFTTLTVPPALVGTPEQVADALLDYYRLGISGFLIRGFDLRGDIEKFGEALIPCLRKGAAEIDAERGVEANAA